MAITIPADWSHLKKAQLVGFVPAAVEPVDTLAQRTHYAYRHHTPALLTAMIWNAAGSGHECFFPITPSADGLTYTIDAWIAHTANDTYTLRAYYTTDSATASASWTLLGTDSAAVTGSALEKLTIGATIPATAKFLKLHTSTGASGSHQLTGVTVYPAATNTPAALNPSGFAAFDDGFLTTGAPIHTEYLNRCNNNAAAVYQDRKWCLFSFIQTDDLTYRLAPATGAGSREIGRARASMPDDLLSRTATVKVRANDSAASDGYVEVYQAGGLTTGATLTADNTDRSTTLTIKGSEPTICARVVSDGTVDVYYVTVTVNPTLVKEGEAKDMITAAAPPARTEYLTKTDGFQSRLFWQPYPVTGLVMDSGIYPAQLSAVELRIGPGIKRFRPCVTRYSLNDGADTVIASAQFKNTDSGGSAHETIHVAHNGTGQSETHPISGSTEEEKINTGFIECGSLTDIAAPGVGDWPSGVDRLCEIVEDDAAQSETFYSFVRVYGFGGLLIESDDVTAL